MSIRLKNKEVTYISKEVKYELVFGNKNITVYKFNEEDGTIDYEIIDEDKLNLTEDEEEELKDFIYDLEF